MPYYKIDDDHIINLNSVLFARYSAQRARLDIWMKGKGTDIPTIPYVNREKYEAFINALISNMNVIERTNE